jgi:hypothetical protein
MEKEDEAGVDLRLAVPLLNRTALERGLVIDGEFDYQIACEDFGARVLHVEKTDTGWTAQWLSKKTN